LQQVTADGRLEINVGSSKLQACHRVNSLDLINLRNAFWTSAPVHTAVVPTRDSMTRTPVFLLQYFIVDDVDVITTTALTVVC